MRTLFWLALLWVASCDSLWTGFKEPNPNSCTFTPGACRTAAPQQEYGPVFGFDHDGSLNGGDTSTDGLQVPLAVGAKLHSCGKVRFQVLVNILKTRGVMVTSSATNSTGDLLARMQPIAGAANFLARVPETIRDTTSSLVGLQDVLIAAAEEWVTMGNPDGVFPDKGTACTGARLFNNNTCDNDGFACLMGATPNSGQLDVCNSMINNVTDGVTDPLIRRRLAVAAMVGTVAICD